MIAVFTFQFSELVCTFYQRPYVEWHGRCKAEFEDTNPNDYPLRGDVTFLNRFQAELSVHLIKEGGLNDAFMVAGLDEQIAAWRREGYPAANDAMVMRYWPKRTVFPEFLGIQIGLRSPKYEHFSGFLTRHFARPDLIGRIITNFHGFSEPHSLMPDLPTEDEFLKGKPYFVMGDHSVTFSAPPLP